MDVIAYLLLVLLSWTRLHDIDGKSHSVGVLELFVPLWSVLVGFALCLKSFVSKALCWRSPLKAECMQLRWRRVCGQPAAACLRNVYCLADGGKQAGSFNQTRKAMLLFALWLSWPGSGLSSPTKSVRVRYCPGELSAVQLTQSCLDFSCDVWFCEVEVGHWLCSRIVASGRYFSSRCCSREMNVCVCII